MTDRPQYGQRAEQPAPQPTPTPDPRPLYGCAAIILAILLGTAAIILAVRW